MDDYLSPASPLLCTSDVWAALAHGKVDDDKEELRQALLYATVELESTRAVAQEQLVRMEGELANIRALLHTTTRERDEARQQCRQAMALLHAIHLQRLDKLSDENGGTYASSAALSTSSDESSMVSAMTGEGELGDLRCVQLASKRELPEKGRLLEAVVKAGPLLQNLLLAGPLPEWRQPPPTPRSLEIPPAPAGTTNLTTPTTSSSWSPSTDVFITDREN